MSSTLPALPAPVAEYIRAANDFDLAALHTCFAADAFVNDARHEYWGAPAIARWLDREIVGDKVTMTVTAASTHHDVVRVQARMDGNYDKTGLPDPLVLTHYFTVRDERIVSLIIMLNAVLPEVELVHRYFELAPGRDRAAYFAQFADDIVVEDEGRERHGLDAVRAWRSEVPPVGYSVASIDSGDAGHDAAVDIAGDFPGSPVRLTFHFEFDVDGHITVLTIRP